MVNPFFNQTLNEDLAPYETREEEGVMAQTTPLPDYNFREKIESHPTVMGVPDIEVVNIDATPFSVDPDIEAQKLYDEADTRFFSALKEVENGVRDGWDKTTETWKPHPSPEGGTDTLGYGHKLSPREQKGQYVMIDGEKVDWSEGLTDTQVDQLFKQDIAKAEKRLAKEIPEYEDLPDKYQKVLLNLSFNAGKITKKGWPKLFKAMKEGDDEGVRREMLTKFKPKDWKPGDPLEPLSTRRNTIADALQIYEQPTKEVTGI